MEPKLYKLLLIAVYIESTCMECGEVYLSSVQTLLYRAVSTREIFESDEKPVRLPTGLLLSE